METASSFIVLLNMVAGEARLDLSTYSLKEGFLGFKLVPSGLHFVSAGQVGFAGKFWCFTDSNQVLVRAFNTRQGGFNRVPPETQTHYEELALSGEIAEELEPYDRRFDAYSRWQKMTDCIARDRFPPTLHEQEVAWKDYMQHHHTYSFADALESTHGGDGLALLEEFQFAFASWTVFRGDPIGLRRWCHLLQAIYKVDVSTIVQNSDLFCRLVDIMMVQFSRLLNDEFKPDAVFYSGYLSEDRIDTVTGAKRLIETMNNSGIDRAVQKAQELAAYINQRENAS